MEFDYFKYINIYEFPNLKFYYLFIINLKRNTTLL